MAEIMTFHTLMEEYGGRDRRQRRGRDEDVRRRTANLGTHKLVANSSGFASVFFIPILEEETSHKERT